MSPRLRTLAQRALLAVLALTALAGLELAMLRAWDAEAQVQAAQGAAAHAELQQLLLDSWRSCGGSTGGLQAKSCGPAPR